MAVHMRALLGFAAGVLALHGVQAQGSLGPGRGKWMQDAPEKHGLSSAALAEAAAEVEQTTPYRYCLLVAKDGVIVHESYFHNTSDSVYETDSLGKSVTSALMGIPVAEGLLDIDTPIKQYGVVPQAIWNASGPNYFDNVTLRHILAQASGYGTVPPGSKMTYDSEHYIQHISYTLTTVAQKHGFKGAYDYVKQKFAVPMGLADLFDYDATGIDFSAGGGQMMSCREIAKVGQLVLNKGKWLDADNKPYQMSDAAYLEQTKEPAFPGIIDGYGLLTWLNTDMAKPADDKGTPRAHCCAPRWANGQGITPPAPTVYATCCEAAPGYNASSVPCDVNLPCLPERPCSDDPQKKCINARDPSEYTVGQNLGDSFPDTDKIVGESERIGFGMGQFAKYMWVDEERNITVSTFGQSIGHSLGCNKGYDDGYTLSLVWRALAKAFKVKPTAEEVRKAMQTEAVEAPFKGTPRAAGDRTRASVREEKQLHERKAAAAKEQGAAAFAGSCTCTCPPGEGFGKCFNIPKSDVLLPPTEGGACPHKVTNALPPAYDWCPAIAYPEQCTPAQVGTNVCSSDQVLVSKCAFVKGSTTFATAGCADTIPARWSSPWGGQTCTWSTTECQYNPFFPPPYDL